MNRLSAVPMGRASLVAVAIAVAFSAALASAAENGLAPDRSSARVPGFRRIFVPADQPANWPTGGERYLPISEDEFTRLLQTAAAGHKTAPGEFAPRLVAARYRATLDASDNLSGEAVLEFHHHGTNPALVHLSPWSLAITGARWQAAGENQQADFTAAAPAVIGNLPDGTLAVLVPASGNLLLKWTLIGKRRATGALQFPFEVCSTTSSRLELTAPAEVVPELSSSLINGSQAGPGQRQWTIDLGGRTGGALRLVATAARDPRQRLALLRQEDSYRISRRGLDCTTLLKIVAHGDSLSSIELEIDPGLELTGATLEGQKLVWSVGPGKLGERRHARVELPKPVSGKCAPITLSAIGRLPLGEHLLLPRPRAANLFWQEGSITLSIEPPLMLNQLETTGARPSLGVASQTPDIGEVFHLQCLSADDEVRIEADFPQTRWSVNEGAHIEFLSGEVVSHSVADFTLDGPEADQVVCRVNPEWQIDAVEAELPTKINEWEVMETGIRRELLVRLRPEETPVNRVRLKIAGRKPFPLLESVGVRELAMLSYPAATSKSQSLLLQTPEALQLQSHGLEAAQSIDLRQLPRDNPLYVDPLPSGIALALNADAERVMISVIPRRPQFNAEIRIVARVTADALEESCEIVCLPSGAALDRLLVHTSKSGNEPDWHWSGDNALGKVTVRKLTREELRSTDPGSDGDAWELSWRLPQRDRLTLRGTRRSPFGAAAPISLVATPEAATQTGQVQIAVEDATEIEIHNRRLKAMPSTAAPAGTIQRVRGTYQFDPGRHGLLRDPAIVVVRPERPLLGNRAWVSEVTLDTRLLSVAAAQHVAVFHIQTLGRPFAQFALPADATVIATEVNGVVIDHAIANRVDHSLKIRLPENVARVSISISFQTPTRLPRLVGRVRAEFPQSDLPVLSRRWRLWLPINYDAPTDSPLASRYCRRTASWSERLVGPLGRGEIAPSRNPFRADFWTQFRSNRVALERANDIASRALQAIGANPSNETTWGEALAAPTQDGLPELLVSWSSLAEAGVSASDHLPTSDARDPLQRGIERLRKQGLSLLVRGRRTLLTASALIALNRRALHPLEGMPAFSVGDGVLATELDRPKVLPDDFLTPAAWQLVPEDSSPSDSTRQVDLIASPNAPTMIELRGTDERQMSVSAFHQPTMFVVSTAIGLLVLGVGVFRHLAGNRFWPLFVAVSFVLALLAPVAWTPLTAALLMGSASAWLLLAVWRKPAHSPELVGVSEARPSSVTQVGLTVSGFLLALVSVAATGMAQQADPTAVPPATTAEAGAAAVAPETVRILVPIDKAQHSVGTNVYLPEQFYTTLLSVAEQVREAPRGWMFTEARYRAAVAGDLLQPDVRKLEVLARFQLQVFESDLTVTLPLGNKSSQLVEGSLLVDGRNVDPTSDAANRPSVVIAQPGKHSIELLIETPIRILGAQAGADLVIPEVANSELELTGADALHVEVPGASDKPTPADSTAQRRLLIGNATRLAIRWPDAIAPDAASASTQVEALYWAHVKPGSVALDARLAIRTAGNAIHGLQLQVDPSMTLLDPQPEMRIVATRAATGNRQLIDLELQTPIVDQRTLSLHFVVPGISGTGNLRLPLCQITGAEPTKRWLAVSVDPVLSYTSDVGETAEAMSPADFARVWDPAVAEPQLAYRLASISQPIAISTQPRSSSATSETTLSLAVEPAGTDVVWSATVSAAEHEFQWQLNVSPTLEVTGLTITQLHGDAVPIRWSRDRRVAIIHATTTTPVHGEYRVTLRGRVAHEVPARLEVPTIEIVRVEPVKQTLLVYQHRHVQVSVSTDSNWEPSPGGPPSVSTSGERLIGEWVTFRPAATAEIQVAPNSVEGSATQVVTAKPVGERWAVEIDCHVVVRSGAVDRLTFDVPASWSLLKLAPDQAAATLTRSQLPEGRLQRLTLRPAELVRGEGHYRIVGQLPVEARLTLRMPALFLEGIDVRSFVLLPKASKQERFQWELSQLVSAELPAPEGSPIRTPSDYQSYRVVGDRPTASLREAGTSSENMRPLHVEHGIRWTADGHYSQRSTFALDRSSKSSVEVMLPSGMTILECRVGGIPVAIEPVDSQRCRIRLPATGAPQWVELLGMGRLARAPQPGTPIEWTAPQLAGVHPETSYWLIHNPYQTARPGEAPKEVWQKLLMSRLTAANAMRPAGEVLRAEKSADAPENRIIGNTLREMEILIADRHLPASMRDAVNKANTRLTPMQQTGASESLTLLAGDTCQFVPEDTMAAVGKRGEGTLSLAIMQSPKPDLLRRIAVALSAVFLAMTAAFGMTAHQRLRVPPIVAGIIVATILWLAVEPLLLPVFALLLTLLWLTAPRARVARQPALIRRASGNDA